MKPNVENALHACGRERVLHREFGGRPAVAIRWDGPARVTAADGTTPMLVREADTLDEAGAAAAEAFAARLDEIADGLRSQARRIREHLAVSVKP